jgi:hypothetical protein
MAVLGAVLDPILAGIHSAIEIGCARVVSATNEGPPETAALPKAVGRTVQHRNSLMRQEQQTAKSDPLVPAQRLNHQQTRTPMVREKPHFPCAVAILMIQILMGAPIRCLNWRLSHSLSVRWNRQLHWGTHTSRAKVSSARARELVSD